MASNAAKHNVIITMNIQGLISNKQKDKVKIIAEHAHEEKALNIALTESHLHKNINDSEINIDGYSIFRADRNEGRKKGGVITYVHNSAIAQCKLLLARSNSFVEFTMLHFSKLQLIFITIYRPPLCPKELFEQFLINIKNKLEEFVSPLPNIVITGDLNFPYVNWDSNNTYGRRDDNDQANDLIKLSEDYCLTQYIKIPTRGENILDLFLANNDELVQDYSVTKSIISDHDIIIINTNINTSTTSTPNHKDFSQTFNKLNLLSKKTKWEIIK